MEDLSGVPEDRGAASGAGGTDFVHLAYELALDPARLPDFVALWQEQLTPATEGPRPAGPTLDLHFERARRILERVPRDQRRGIEAILAGILRVPAFLSDGVVRIAACNLAAESAFRISAGAPLAALPFDAADVVALSSTIRRVARRAVPARNLRLRSVPNGTTVVVRVCPIDGQEGRAKALVLATEPVWPEPFGELLNETFGLTGAEVEIVHGLTLGLPLREIASLRGRSVETVRTQMRSIQQKTETHSQSELLRLVMGLMELALAPAVGAPPRSAGRLHEPLMRQSFLLPDGRRLEWLEFGDPVGAPVLYLHGEFGLARWTPAAERAARLRRLRVIVPIRAGYGRSDPLPEETPFAEGNAADLAALAGHLGLPRVAVLALGGDLGAALWLARSRPGLVTGIAACALDLPDTAAAHWPGLLARTAERSPAALALMVQAAFAFALDGGKEHWLLGACGGAAADRLALRIPGVREALLVGSEICLGAETSAHAAFCRSRIEACRALPPGPAQSPLLFLQGGLDPLAPPADVAALAARTGAEVEVLAGCARLLFLEQWETVLNRLCSITAR